MTSTEITEQIATYFAWLEGEVGSPMHRPTAFIDERPPDESARVVELAPATAPSHRQARRPFVLAALAAAAIIAVLLVVRASGDATPVVPADSVSTVSIAPAPSQTDTVVAAVTTISTSLPTPTAVAARPVIDTLALGDSVMQGALVALTGAGVNVDVQESRQATGMIATLAANLATYDVTDAVVIQVGTNGPVTAEQFEQLADLVADVPHVYFMTIKAPKDWVAPNNVLINGLPATHPNVTVIDWATAGQQIESELSPADGGIHLNSETASRFYANLVLGAVGKPTIPNP